MSVKKKPSKAAPRCRGWSVVSQNLTAEHLRAAVDALPASARAVAMVHDRDSGTHGHLFLYDQATPRTEAAVRRLFPVPVIVRPYVTLPEDYEPDPGKQTGKFAMARAARYLTHEHPSEQAKGKVLYADEEMICRPAYDWRADVDALNQRERVRPMSEDRLPLAERVRRQVLRGQLTARQVFEQYPEIYAKQRPSVWDDLEARGQRWAAEDAREQARAAREVAEAERVERARREREAQAAREAAETERRRKAEAEEQARAQAAREAEEQARQRWQQAPERAEHERERDRLRMVAVLAWEHGDGSQTPGDDLDDLAARATAALRDKYAADPELGADVLPLSGDYAEGGALTYEDARTAVEDLEHDPDDLAADLAELEEAAVSTRAEAARRAAMDLSPVAPAAAYARLQKDVETVRAGGEAQGSEQYARAVARVVCEDRTQARAMAATGWLRVRLAEQEQSERQAMRAWAGLG